MDAPPIAPTHTLEAVVEDLARPVLPENPFPNCVTACNAAVVERFGTWAEAERVKVEADLERLRERNEPAEEWEVSALRHAVHTWRIFATMHRLHEEGWCPALLFRLTTKTDLHVLFDPATDSSASGFGDRQKRVLARRGIGDRFAWVAARRMVGAMGFLEGVPCKRDEAGAAEEHPTVEENAVETLAEASPVMEIISREEADAGEPQEQKVPKALPQLHLDHVWTALPGYTKKQLGGVYDRFGCGLWSQFGDRFYGSMRKAEMLTFVQRVVRHHACLDAAMRLTVPQLDAFHDWMESHLSERYHKDDDLRIAARLFRDFQAVATLHADGHGLSPEAWTRYRDAELRQIGAFCYHHFIRASEAEMNG